MNKVNILLKDRALVRWSMLILLASMMFFAYMFVDVLSPLKSMLETTRGWTSENFGTVTGSEYFLNVFALFLIFAGIILDKMGVRFTAILSALVMLAGAAIKYYALTDAFIGSGLETWLNSWWVSLPASAKLASLGFMIFGCGVEMAGVTVSKGIVKWFKGKELALAMGVEMAIARLGVFAVFRISPRIAESTANVSTPVLLCMILLIIGLLAFTVYFFFDRTWKNKWASRAKNRKKNSRSATWENSSQARLFCLFQAYAYCIILPFSRSRNLPPICLNAACRSLPQTLVIFFHGFP